MSKQPDEPYFEIRRKNLCEDLPQSKQSDDYVYIIFYKERVVALVTETKNDFNNINFSFFKNLENLL